MSLVCDICLLELELICMIIVIHVPGKVIIVKGTDTLSQELLLYPRGGKGGISPIIPLSQPALTFFPLLKLCFILGEILNFRRNLRWGIRQIYPLEISRSSCTMILRYLSPTIAEKGFSCALQYWYESPWDSSHLFIVPRIILIEFRRVSKSVQYIGQSWDMPVGSDVVVAFVLFYISPFNYTRTFYLHKLNIATNAPSTPRIPQSIQKELLAMHMMSQRVMYMWVEEIMYAYSEKRYSRYGSPHSPLIMFGTMPGVLCRGAGVVVVVHVT